MSALSALAYNHKQVMKAARRRRKRILQLFNEGTTQKALSAIYGISIQRVSQILAEARREQ